MKSKEGPRVRPSDGQPLAENATGAAEAERKERRGGFTPIRLWVDLAILNMDMEFQRQQQHKQQQAAAAAAAAAATARKCSIPRKF